MAKTCFEWDPDKDATNQEHHGVAVIGERERLSLSGQVKYRDEPSGKIVSFRIFIPLLPNWRFAMRASK